MFITFMINSGITGIMAKPSHPHPILLSARTRNKNTTCNPPSTRVDAYTLYMYITKFSFYPNAIHLWNNLPDYIASAQSIDSF